MLATSSREAYGITIPHPYQSWPHTPSNNAAVVDVPRQVPTKLRLDETVVIGERAAISPASSSVSAGSEDSGYGTGSDPRPCEKSKHSNPRRRAPSNFQPPSLPNQQEASLCFVKVLICFSTGLVASIWPFAENGGIPLFTFISESLRRSRTSYSTLQVALYYLVLLKQHIPSDDLSREQIRGTDHITMQCGRRMFLAALILAGKYLQDKNYSTTAWEKITGLDAPEINKNERMFLHAIDYRLHMTKECFADWNQLVIDVCDHSKRVNPIQYLDHMRSNMSRLEWSNFVRMLNPRLIRDKISKEASLQNLLRDSFSISVYEFPIDRHIPPTTGSNSTSASQRWGGVAHQIQNAERALNAAHGYPTPSPTPSVSPGPFSNIDPFELTDRFVASATALANKPAANLTNLPGPSPPYVAPAHGLITQRQNVSTHKRHGQDTVERPSGERQGIAPDTVFAAQTLIAMAKVTTVKRQHSGASKSPKRQCTSFDGALADRTRYLVMTGQSNSDEVLDDPLPLRVPSRTVEEVCKSLRKDLVRPVEPARQVGDSAKNLVPSTMKRCGGTLDVLDNLDLAQWEQSLLKMQKVHSEETERRQRGPNKWMEKRKGSSGRYDLGTTSVFCN